MATEYKLGLDPELRKMMVERGFTFDNNSYKPKRQLMATDVIRELKKLVEENGDKPVFVSTGFNILTLAKFQPTPMGVFA